MPGNNPSITPQPSLLDLDYWLRVLCDASRLQWTKVHGRSALLSLPIVAAWIFIALEPYRRHWMIYAVAGTVFVGFGAFQKLGQSRFRPMVMFLIGIAVASWAGNVAGYLGWYVWVILTTLCGFGFGVMTMLGYGAWWIGLQWMIALVVFGSHALPPQKANANALALLAGGGSQLLYLMAIMPFADRWFTPQEQPPLNPLDSVPAALAHNAHPAHSGGRYALRVAACMAICTVIVHFWNLSNDYWVPMTAAILLKPDFHEATIRGVNRLVGTLTGAGLTTLVLALARPGPFLLGCLLLLAIFGCLALMRVNYAIFVVCVTAYVVLLFSMLGLPEPIVALHRVMATLVGAAAALLVSLRPQVASQNP